ncbi:MAG: hypothetical protein NTX86_01240 [Candidatus Dependentiae bacterium]|nr:hypothetical protein [Candidatus Dependentiae bacterium]
MNQNFKLIIASSFFFIHVIANSNDPMNSSYLLNALAQLEQGQNIIFTKYGDGEYNCMIGIKGENCDFDKYHAWLGAALKKALISLSKKNNTYIGRWWHPSVPNFCNKLAAQHNTTIPWAWYHLFMNDDEFLQFDYMYKFVRFIVKTDRKKILLCNGSNSRLKDFFKADVYIELPSQNWSFQYNQWKNTLEPHLEQNAIVLIGGGLCSKVLIDDITNNYNLTCIDIGSSFDLLGRKKNTRGWKHTYEDEIRYYKDFIPSSWL